jgi:hypothetical protein
MGAKQQLGFSPAIQFANGFKPCKLIVSHHKNGFIINLLLIIRPMLFFALID